ncbi:MAG: L-threonylcarbamoyladenylate synthase [Xanthomonadales bacterium]
MTGPQLATVRQGAQCLVEGGVIAYPTEAVYGLGCDPDNESAVRHVLRLKTRPESAGLILIADRLERFAAYIGAVSAEQKQQALAAWPGPVTWLFPRSATVPDWLAGDHSTIALRITAHPVCRALCEAFGGPIVSTSANPGTAKPARSAEEVDAYFGAELCAIVEGRLGEQSHPSEIRDLATGRVIRSA